MTLSEASDADFADLLEGRGPRGWALPDSPIAPREVLSMLRQNAAAVRQSLAPAAWLLVEDGEVVGLCSVVKPPTDRALLIGYGIAPSRQGRGHATEAVACVAREARRLGYEALVAETAADNFSSQAVLKSNAFVATGSRLDPEDGPVLRWTLRLDGRMS